MAEEVANGNGAAPTEAPVTKVSQFESLTPYLYIEPPKAAEAIEWYIDVFGFELVIKMYHEKRKAEQEEPLLMHAHLKNGNLELMLADDIAGEYLRPPSQLKGTTFNLALFCTDADSVVEAAVKKGATVTMEVKDQFWGSRFGKFKDPFGFEWAICGKLKETSVEKPEVEDAPEPAVTTET